MSYWRQIARPIVAEVLQRTAGEDEATVRRELTKAYPFGERRMWPYKAWLAEVKEQRKKTTPLHSEAQNYAALEAAGQLTLAEE